jgi:hypothetical protein
MRGTSIYLIYMVMFLSIKGVCMILNRCIAVKPRAKFGHFKVVHVIILSELHENVVVID